MSRHSGIFTHSSRGCASTSSQTISGSASGNGEGCLAGAAAGRHLRILVARLKGEFDLFGPTQRIAASTIRHLAAAVDHRLGLSHSARYSALL